MVAHVRHRRKLETQGQALREMGMLTTAELATQLSVSQDCVRSMACKGILRRCSASRTRFLYEPPTEDDPVWDIVKRRGRKRDSENSIQSDIGA